MRVAFFGSVKFSMELLKVLLGKDNFELVALITKSRSSFNSDFEDLSKIEGIPQDSIFYYDKKSEVGLEDFLVSKAPDIIYCFGWSHLLNNNLLSIPKRGAIGYHPAKLPQNKGRHPIIWALCLGLKETASTFFYLNDAVDGGDIISQESVPIEESDYAIDLYDKLCEFAKIQLSELHDKLSTGKEERLSQSSLPSNYWRKRTQDDGRIDWRMDASKIYNLIRSLSPPYPGATCVLNGQSFKIYKSKIIPYDKDNIEPGKILSSDSNSFTVKCGLNALKVSDHNFSFVPKEGTYL